MSKWFAFTGKQRQAQLQGVRAGHTRLLWRSGRRVYFCVHVKLCSWFYQSLHWANDVWILGRNSLKEVVRQFLSVLSQEPCASVSAVAAGMEGLGEALSWAWKGPTPTLTMCGEKPEGLIG